MAGQQCQQGNSPCVSSTRLRFEQLPLNPTKAVVIMSVLWEPEQRSPRYTIAATAVTTQTFGFPWAEACLGPNHFIRDLINLIHWKISLRIVSLTSTQNIKHKPKSANIKCEKMY